MSSQSYYLWNFFFLPHSLLLFFSAGMDAQHDMEELRQRFNVLRPEILETLSKMLV
jgi:hypothetical protein